MPMSRPFLLPRAPEVSTDLASRVRSDYERFAVQGLPADLDDYLLQSYEIDMTASYAGQTIRNPWGKASGQLSLNRPQIEEAADARLGFVVLKTVIAQDAQGHRSMSAWAIKEAQMLAEPITSPKTGAKGWTITWKGRGWWQSFADYLELVRASAAIGRERDLLIVPSVKYHLPAAPGEAWREDEYRETTRQLLLAYQSGAGPIPMPIEKDFSPTLAGSDLASRARSCSSGSAESPD